MKELSFFTWIAWLNQKFCYRHTPGRDPGVPIEKVKVDFPYVTSPPQSHGEVWSFPYSPSWLGVCRRVCVCFLTQPRDWMFVGGGVPVGSCLLIDEDRHSTYSSLLFKYFLAEGVVTKQKVLVASANQPPSSILQVSHNELPGFWDTAGWSWRDSGILQVGHGGALGYCRLVSAGLWDTAGWSCRGSGILRVGHGGALGYCRLVTAGFWDTAGWSWRGSDFI